MRNSAGIILNKSGMDPTKQYLSSKLNPILEPMVTQILVEKPNNPAEFMIKWLEKQQKRPAGKPKSGGRPAEDAKAPVMKAEPVRPPPPAEKKACISGALPHIEGEAEVRVRI